MEGKKKLPLICLSFLLISLVAISRASFAQTNPLLKNMRRCALLPVLDNVDGAIAYKVFQQVEVFLKKSSWCAYQSNNELLSVFSTYREQLKEYLGRSEVLKVVASKLNVGSVIRLDIEAIASGLKLEISIYSSNGDMKIFTKTENISDQKIEVINGKFISWLKEYGKAIPYDGYVIGVLGKELTFDTGESRNFHKDQAFEIYRLQSQKKHPLLGYLVAWDKELIGVGAIKNYSLGQVVGAYNSDTEIQKGDWINIKKEDEKKELIERKTEKENSLFGKLGFLKVGISAQSLSATTNGTFRRKVNGILWGMNLDFEAWLTRNYFGVINYGLGFGDLSKSSENLESNSYSLNNQYIKLLLGYRFLPMDYFYGPRLDIYAGWSNFTYDLDISISEGFGKNSFSGPTVGAKIDLPLLKTTRAYARAEIIVGASFSDEDSIFISEASASSLQFEIGSDYQWSSQMLINGGLQITSNKMKFDAGEIRQLQYQDTAFKVGIIYLF
jgi:hypothetical protein